jgi:hypothetical protein
MNVRGFLTSPIAYLPPEKTLEGLSAADAERHIPSAPHSIAEIVAHLAFWQDWFHARCIGQAAPIVSSAAEGWPTVTADSWPVVRSRFLDRLQQIAALAEGDIKPHRSGRRSSFRRLRVTPVAKRSSTSQRTTPTTSAK